MIFFKYENEQIFYSTNGRLISYAGVGDRVSPTPDSVLPFGSTRVQTPTVTLAYTAGQKVYLRRFFQRASSLPVPGWAAAAAEEEEAGVMDVLDAAELEELRRERRRQRRQRLTACCKSAVAFLFSNLGLAAMVVAYSIMGGFLFQVRTRPICKLLSVR